VTRARRLVSALCLAVLALPASAGGVAHHLLVNGDSLAVGTKPYLTRELRGWRVTQSTEVSRHAAEGAAVMRAYGASLPPVVHVSLGTNDDPRQVSSFRAAIREVMRVAGPERCVVWTNIVRPAVKGRGYGGYNRALAQESRARDNLRIVDWAALVRRHRGWLSGDGVHVTAEGYRGRARAVARTVRDCRPG
jgi:lysophospholipase L1-like esterase